MIELQGKPSYPPDQCPVCSERQAKKNEAVAAFQHQLADAAKEGPKAVQSLGTFRTPCDRCGEPIPPYENVPAGYEAQTIDHWHIIVSGAINGYKMVRDTLCLPCYREDWKKVYPDEPLPV